VSWAVAGTSSPHVHAPRARDGTGQEFRRKRPATIELPDHTGRPRNLSELPAGDRMIVVLAREAYSAKDQLQHERLGQPWREMTPGVGDCRMSHDRDHDPQEVLKLASLLPARRSTPAARALAMARRRKE
jgi:hypothetical protein